jgi:transposase
MRKTKEVLRLRFELGLGQRQIALGRKNWIHIGSPQAGPKVAAILSVLGSCRRLKLPVRDYLAAVLPGFGDLPIQRLPDLTPAAWVAQHS